jgi:tripartite-type tricarboxylate transporter receptor subunit TctC
MHKLPEESRRTAIKKSALAACAFLTPQFFHKAIAQQRLLKIVVPLTPGTTPDLIARAIGPLVGQRLDINFTVDNRVGASSMIGMSYVAKTTDTNTLMIVPATTVTLPLLYKTVDFDVINSFTPITQVTSTSFVLVVGPQIPVKNLNDFVVWTKTNKNQFYASPGSGTHHHLSMELLKQITGAEIEHIAYKGSAPAFNDFLSGQIPAMFMPIQVAVPLNQAGKLRIIGGSLKERHPNFPDIPSLHELGAKDFNVDPWYSVWGPPNLSKNLIESYRNAIISSLNDNSIKDTFQKQGLIIKTTTPSELVALTKAEFALWSRVIGLTNIKPE